jgi:hypothetical protein
MVYEPEELDLKDHKYVHVMECAECTRDLMAFRRARNEERGQRSATPPIAALGAKNKFSSFAFSASVAASLLVGAVLAWQLKPKDALNMSASREEVVDLSSATSSRGTQGDASVLLMRDVGTYIIELPPLSPSGHYHVALVNKSQAEMISVDSVTRDAKGHLELPVKLDLAAVPDGDYRMAIKSEQDTAPYFYNVHLR